MEISEVVLPSTEPETEWVRGRAVQKMSPRRDHARLQMRIAAQLDAWAGDRGEVGTEWRFRLAPPGQRRRPLVPDIAFVSRDRLSGRSRDEIQAPDFAPTVALEILSPDDDPRDVADKIRTYLAADAKLVIVVDPAKRSFELHDGGVPVTLAGAAFLRHAVLPDFELDLAATFAGALDLEF